MPLPIGHSLSAYAIYDVVHKKEHRFSMWTLVSFIFVANLADFDYIPGYFLGNPNILHRHFFSHSLGASVVAGIIFGGISSLMDRRSFFFSFCLFTSLYFSHVVLDFFSADASRPYGVPLFWPFSQHYFMSHVSIFMGIEKSGESHSFLQSLFVRHNIIAALWEFIVFLPVIACIKFIKWRNKVGTTLFHKRHIPTKQVSDNT